MWLNMNRAVIIVVVIIGVASRTTLGTADEGTDCPGLYKHTFRDSVPKGNLSSGVYSAYDGDGTGTVSLRDCVLACCVQSQCNVALSIGAGGCYHVTCVSNELCLPQSGSSRTNMVLVRPVNPNDVDSDGPSWADVLLRSGSDNNQQRYHEAFDSLWRMSDSHQQIDQNEINRSDTSDLLDRISYSTIKNNGEATTDLPATLPSTGRPQGKLHVIVKSKEVQLPENNVTLVAQVQELNSKVQYQYEWITLQQPDGQSGAIRSQQDNRLELSHLSQGLYMFNVTVSSKVGANSGWALANVSVLGAVRVNTPPTIVITPNNQTVRLPNTAAILDASATSDDVDAGDKVQYHWELKQAPLGYEPILVNTATLQLSDLTQPGQYTFQVTAVDSEGAQATALAYVTVLPPIDYPPTADVGPDQVLYLPLNDGELVLSGNGSTDDHDIVSWEWTRVNSVTINSSDTNANNMQAVDMRDTRTPMLRLGRIIEPGVYTFQLRVEDASNQTSTAQVRLFIKENGQGRWTTVAVANADIVTLPLGRSWLLLDGKNSTVIDTTANAPDDSGVQISDPTMYYKWDLLQSPSNKTVQISSPHEALSNVTGLTAAGFYQFRLQVSTQDTLNNNSSSTAGTSSIALVNVTVKNPLSAQKPPHAVATIADSNVQLPRNAIYLNASESTSSADSMIVSYMWNPCIDSPLVAAMGQGGSVAEGTDKHPVLVLVLANMLRLEEAVEVCWNVTVRDREGLTDWATVRFNVLPDIMLEYLVEILIGGAKDLTAGEYSALIEALESADPSIHIYVRTTVGSTATAAHALLTIYATTTSNNDTLTSDDLTTLLLLHSDQLSSHFDLISIRPASCRSVRCSGHGHCDSEIRTCHCQALWMPNLWLNAARSGRDCSWSVLYVTLVGLSAVCGVLCVVYVVCCRCCYRLQHGKPVTLGSNGGQQKQRYHTRRSRGRSHNHSYTLIDNTLTGEGTGKLRSKPRLSDSDSDVVDRAAAYSAAIASGDSDDDRDDNVVFSSLHKMPRNNNKLLFNNT